MSKELDQATEITINEPVEISYDDIATDNNPPSTQYTPSMMDMVLLEVKRLASVSKGYQQKITESKTKPKRDLYTKKLKKNNKNLGDMLLRLDNLNKLEAQDD